MTFTLAEGLVGQIKAYVEANLAAKVAALNSEYNDGITLEDRKTTVLGVKSLKSIEVGNYPAFYVFSTHGTYAGTVLGLNPVSAEIEAKPEIAVGILVIDQDTETLQKRLYRYSRALIELMFDGTAAGTMLGGWNLFTDQEWEIDTVTALFSDSADSPFVGETTLTMRANKRESK